MEKFSLLAIGTIRTKEGNICIELAKQYIPALKGLEGFSHINVLWWFSGCDNARDRGVLEEKAPYRNGPAVMGTFATRSPTRPNPIAMSCAGVTYVDHDRGVIGLTYIDARYGTPVLDIKPYTPSLDRVEHPSVPDWCAHWPKCIEESGVFNWEIQLNH